MATTKMGDTTTFADFNFDDDGLGSWGEGMVKEVPEPGLPATWDTVNDDRAEFLGYATMDGAGAWDFVIAPNNEIMSVADARLAAAEAAGVDAECAQLVEDIMRPTPPVPSLGLAVARAMEGLAEIMTLARTTGNCTDIAEAARLCGASLEVALEADGRCNDMGRAVSATVAMADDLVADLVEATRALLESHQPGGSVGPGFREGWMEDRRRAVQALEALEGNGPVCCDFQTPACLNCGSQADECCDSRTFACLNCGEGE